MPIFSFCFVNVHENTWQVKATTTKKTAMCIIFILEGDSQPWKKQGRKRTGIFQEMVLKGKESVVKVLQTWLGSENKSVFPQPFILKPSVPFPCKGAGRELDLIFWQIARELHSPRWAIQTAEVRCLGCPFNPQAPLKTSPERPMCWGWKKGGGNGANGCLWGLPATSWIWHLAVSSVFDTSGSSSTPLNYFLLWR